MLKYFFLFIALTNNLFSQSLELKAEYKAEKEGLLPCINVVKNPDDNKIYVVARETINKQQYITLYDNSFKRLACLPVTSSVDINESFIRNGKLYFADSYLKFLSLNDYKIETINNDRKNISRYSMQMFNGKEVILVNNSRSWIIYDIATHKELLNIKIESGEKNIGRAVIFNNEIFYTSEGNEVTKFDPVNNKIGWSVKFPDKPVKLLGIKLTSMPNTISCINPYKKNDRFYVGISALSGDYFTLDAATGRLVKEDKQFDRFESLSQNNSKLFVHSYLFNDKTTNRILIYAGSVDKNVYCINEKDYSTVWETATGNEIQMPLSLLDINGDGFPEIFGVNDYDNILFVLDGKTGKKIIFQSIKEGKLFNQPKVFLADFYGTGKLNLIIKINNEKIKVFEMQNIHIPKNFLNSNKNIY